MQRRSVDLPDPDAPMRQTTSCSATHEVDPAQDLELAERLVQALDAQGLGGHLAAPDGARRRSRATSQSTSVDQAGSSRR